MLCSARSAVRGGGTLRRLAASPPRAAATAHPLQSCCRHTTGPTRPPTPSLLLQHIHHSIPAVARLYGGAGGIPEADPATPEEGEAVIAAFCRKLGMGLPAVRRWRAELHGAAHRRWGTGDGSGDCSAAPLCAAPEAVAARVTLLEALTTAAAASGNNGGSSAGEAAALLSLVGQPQGRRFFQPRPMDVAFVRGCMRHLRLVLSPLVTLSPPGQPTAEAATRAAAAAAARPTTYADGSSFYATRAIPAGMFVVSVPTEAVFFAEPPPAADPILSYFMCVEDLVGQLVAAGEADDDDDGAAPPPHDAYIRYLRESVVPPRNLPFLTEKDLFALVGADAAAEAEAEADTSRHPAWALWRFFTEDMRGEPLSGYLQQRLSPAEYQWWVSVVLSRREGAATLVPVVDKLNHSFLPNCHYTMSSDQSFCCLDALDNIMAGVAPELVYQPHVHVYAIRDIQPGEELTLCYSSPADGLYRPASGGGAAPARPPSLDNSHDSSGYGSSSSSSSPSEETAAAVFAALFSNTAEPGAAPRHLSTPSSSALSALLHPGPQQVGTPAGRSSWQLQWGFVPPYDAVYSSADLREVAALVAEKRVNGRRELFPAAEQPCVGPADRCVRGGTGRGCVREG